MKETKEHKIKFLGQLPENEVGLALSGGHDSMAILDFLLLNKKRTVKALFFHHKTETSEQAYNFLKDYCKKRNVELITGYLSREKHKSESLEEFWRNERLNFIKSFKELSVITGHNLDDAVETYLFNSIHGKSHTIAYRNENIIRPFMLTKKETLKLWCDNKKVPFVEDKSNADVRFSRNRIRHNILPEVLKINPGIYKVVKKKLIEDFDLEKENSNRVEIKRNVRNKF